MKTNRATQVALAVGLCSSVSHAQSSATACSTVLVPTYSPPSVASGWQAQLVAGGLTKPRSIQFDSTGALIVVESGKGISRHTFTDNGGTCLSVATSSLLVNQTNLNHGLAISKDGKTIYASTVESVFAWSFDAAAGTVGATSRALIDNMGNNDLVTRTLLMSAKQDGMLVVSRGSSDDLMVEAESVSSGLSQIRAFNLANITSSSDAYDFDTEGLVLGWGLRNSVGVGEHPITGGIYAVENSVDGVTRDGTDIHEHNPGEELNFFGYLNSSAVHRGGNYGYPKCYAVWNVTEIPENAGLAVGDQFAITENSTLTDETCASDYVAPRLTFPAHMAPLDIKFTSDGSEAYVTFHGSFDSTNPVGYRLTSVAFNPTTGEPIAAADSTTALTDIMSNPDISKCPGSCFRPVGLAWDSAGRLWMSSDTTGEIYVLMKTSATATPSATASGTIVTATGSPKSAAGRLSATTWGWAAAVAVVGALMVAL